MTAIFQSSLACRYCGNYHTGSCPLVKAFEYYPDGSIKRVEFFSGSTLEKSADNNVHNRS